MMSGDGGNESSPLTEANTREEDHLRSVRISRQRRTSLPLPSVLKALRDLGGVQVGVQEPSRPRSQRGNTTQQEDHPFLELQQAGFHMLERELGAVRQSITRLCCMQVLLQPLAHIADNEKAR
ncbi:hypothetical protein SKAU_G00410440 [Synaphobranchus kaupii]|uniref:Uncharacterized protein n=1 Tax=Synaphobranchus kaupii TaxID=118154 RepID=A0A9Q1E7M3_SYNKA|nr:hypothetical protein SKAU_G00410440 [Synaphobranchus kaupii]